MVKSENLNDVQETTFDESKIQITNEPIPQWLYLDEKAFLLIGWAGHRTRQGRSGYDPLERDFEYAHIQGTIFRALLVGRFRTRNPFYLGFMVFVGVLYFMYGILPFLFWNLIGVTGIIFVPYSIIGSLLLVNAYRSLRLEKISESEDMVIHFSSHRVLHNQTRRTKRVATVLKVESKTFFWLDGFAKVHETGWYPVKRTRDEPQTVGHL